MRTWFPYPLLSVALLLMWLLLSQSVTPGSILLGLIVSTVLAWVTLKLKPARSRLNRWSRLAGFILRATGDVIRSNIAVTLIILRARRRPVTAGFMTLGIDLEDENALAMLACVLTATPGTAWLEYDRRQNILLIHVLDIENAELWRKTIRRYAADLKEIFE